DLADDGVVLFTPCLVNTIVRILASDGPVRRNDIDVQLVNIVKLGRFRVGGSGHTGQFVIKPEVILNRDRRQRLSFPVNLDSFFRFDSLVQSITPTPTWHLATGIFVYNDDLVILNDVSNILLEQTIGPE